MRIAVKGREADHTHFDRLAVGSFGLNQLAFGVLFLELNFLSGQLINFAFTSSVRHHNQVDFCAGWTANFADDIAELFLNEVFLSPVLFGHPHDFVFDL